MKTTRTIVVILLGMTLLFGCSSSKTSVVRTQPILEPVKTIAMAPSGGLFADAIGVALFNKGFEVIDTAQMSSMLIRLNLNEIELMNPQKLSIVRDSGVDVLLSARAVAGYDGKPQSASVRLTSTKTGAIISGITWQNGWGGQAGSLVDRAKRKDLAEAADEIAKKIAETFSKP